MYEKIGSNSIYFQSKLYQDKLTSQRPTGSSESSFQFNHRALEHNQHPGLTWRSCSV